jgi:hypothetical protein
LTGISDVVVQGFTVTNAPFEGILATNAANVAIVDQAKTCSAGLCHGCRLPATPDADLAG